MGKITNVHRINITMEDDDIPASNMNIRVLTERPLSDVLSSVNIAFTDYDRNVTDAEPFREEFGWGLESFIKYLRTRYPDWTIVPEIVDAEITLVGV